MAAHSSLAQADSSSPLPPAIFLMGPTASGKTAVALEVVRSLPCEIISVDSAQIYRHMDIGTAKPDAATLKVAPHHLIDVIEPDETYSVARFRIQALSLMRAITKRGKIPLLVGGTMMYFKALLEGLAELPEADMTVRMVIDEMARTAGWPALHEELQRVDPQSAERLNPNDAQRIQRALEVFYLTDRPMSELQKVIKPTPLPYATLQLALMPSERAELHARIESRFETMLELGLIGELRKLREQYALDPAMPSMRCVGYRQTWRYLNNEIALATLRMQGNAATRQLAKRQMTWLRAMPDVTTFDCLSDDLSAKVLGYLNEHLPQRPE